MAREPLPLGTDLQVGDVLRLDGLSVKGKSRIDHRIGAYYTVGGLTNQGLVVLLADKERNEAAKVTREHPEAMYVGWTDLAAMIETAVFVLLEE